ncbi:MAG TPA: hypothetical protein H9824_05465 [Candidatus Bacteroides pullicola]|uniref:Fimbrillin family protein n=1 Tax=Candidatus Bacteroides pullicola TaxID=2838475 RepID=A0A9D2CL71_9BACE|nr:hypothetical protein [Candidatus Bacteroides pullicola]
MRTKHLLYTMALASVFAACTQDEFVTESGNSNPLEGRKSLGKITLVEPEAASTRWTVEDWYKITPEVGDGFSYLLVDDPLTGLAGQHEYPIDNYQLINQIHTNYVFKLGAQGWTSDANLVEGNYLLVGPAQNVQNRKPVEVTLPAEQNLTAGTDGKVDPLSIIKEFNKSGYPIYIGHRFLSEGSKYNNVLPARYHIFAYPEITVKNSAPAGATEVPRVVKVVLKSEDETKPFVINAPLDNENAAKVLTNESFEAAGIDTKDQYVVGAWEGYMNDTLGINKKDLMVEQKFDKTQKVNQQPIPADATYEVTDRKTGMKWSTFRYNKGLGGSTSDLLAEQPTSVSPYIVINMPGEGVDLKAQESFKFNAIIPAGSYDMTEDLIIYAVLSNGDVWKKKVNSNNKEININPGKRYPQEDYNGTEVRAEKGLYFTIDVYNVSDGVSEYEKVDASQLPGIGDADAVMTTEELVAALAEKSSTTTKNITIGGKNVVYDQRAEDALANNNAQIVNILGHIKIEGAEDKALNINSKVSFADAVINKGTVVFDSKTATLGTVLVGKGATLELRNAGKEGSNYTAEIHNAGTLKLYEAAFANVYNYETLEVYNDVQNANITNSEHACSDRDEIISEAVNLTPSVDIKYQVLADKTFVPGKYKVSESELDYPIVVESLDKDKFAELILGDDVTIVKNGSIKNNGKITSSASETLTVACGLGETLTNGVNGVIDSKVIIESANYLLSTVGAGKDIPTDYKAAAEVTNNGILNNVKVDGKLTMGAGSRINGTIEAEIQTEGEINNTAMGVIVGTPAPGVKVYAVFNGLNLTNDDAIEAEQKAINAYQNYKVNLIRLNGEVKVGDEDVTFGKTGIYGGTGIEIEFAAGSSLSIGFATLTSDLDISVSAPAIQWNGKTETDSSFSLTGSNGGKRLYLDYETGKVAEGYVDFNNCAKVPGLAEN